MYLLYFDPGLGALIVQSIVAAIAGVILFSKNLIYKIKSFFGFKIESDSDYENIEIEEKDTSQNNSVGH